MGERLALLYIDAPEEARALRELVRLRMDSPYSTRKADLTITLEQVTDRIQEKDEKKRALSVFDYPSLCLTGVGA